MISFSMPRFCDQLMSRSRKQVHYKGQPDWIAKLDTIVHELYHIDPAGPGIRRMERADGTYSANCHGHRFFEKVVEMVNQYLATKPDPAVYDFLTHNLAELTGRFGGVAGTAFKSFPSYPQRYTQVLDPQPAATPDMNCRVEPLKVASREDAVHGRRPGDAGVPAGLVAQSCSYWQVPSSVTGLRGARLVGAPGGLKGPPHVTTPVLQLQLAARRPTGRPNSHSYTVRSARRRESWVRGRSRRRQARSRHGRRRSRRFRRTPDRQP